MAELLDHLFIDRSFEGDDQLWQAFHRLPVPGVELRLVAAGRRVDLDFALIAIKAEGKPFLCLTAILAA